jgi:dTDP-4-dehydrorhamnose 3,5-epimerase-like enzyme
MKVEKFKLTKYSDSRGTLIAFEGEDYHFKIARVFTISECIEKRGGHAHKHTDQIVFVPHGVVLIKTIDNSGKDRVDTLRLGDALFIPKMTFVETIELFDSAVLVVLANTRYVKSDSIREKQEFLNNLIG